MTALLLAMAPVALVTLLQLVVPVVVPVVVVAQEPPAGWAPKMTSLGPFCSKGIKGAHHTSDSRHQPAPPSCHARHRTHPVLRSRAPAPAATHTDTDTFEFVSPTLQGPFRFCSAQATGQANQAIRIHTL